MGMRNRFVCPHTLYGTPSFSNHADENKSTSNFTILTVVLPTCREPSRIHFYISRHSIIVIPTGESYPLSKTVTACGLMELMISLAKPDSGPASTSPHLSYVSFSILATLTQSP